MWVAAVALVGFVGACDSAPEEPPAAERGEYQGLSRDQIEAEATPMSPEEAERLGIIDTTIRLQPPMNPDSVVPLDSSVIR